MLLGFYRFSLRETGSGRFPAGFRWPGGPGSRPGRVYPKSCNLSPRRRQPPLPAGPDASRATVTVKEARTTGRSESEAPRLSDVTITDGLSLSLSLRVPLSLSLSQAPGSDSDSPTVTVTIMSLSGSRAAK